MLWSAIAISINKWSRAKEGESVSRDIARSLPREIDLIGFDTRGGNDDSER